MHIECHTGDLQPRQRHGLSRHSKESENKARDEKEPSRTEYEKKAQGSPAITNSPQMRCVRPASIGMESNGDFGNPRPVQTRLKDHFRGEFHSFALKFQSIVQFTGESTKATINIMNGRGEHMPCHLRKQRVPQPPV